MDLLGHGICQEEGKGTYWAMAYVRRRAMAEKMMIGVILTCDDLALIEVQLYRQSLLGSLYVSCSQTEAV